MLCWKAVISMGMLCSSTLWGAPFNVNTVQREQSRNFFNTVYSASENVPIQWTGDTASGNAGATGSAFKDAVALRINYFRAMTGVPSAITLNSVYSAKDQQAALMMSANDALSHNPPNSWLYYTVDGAAAAGNSNLSLGDNGPDAITGYIQDLGSNNTAVGHRRWLLYPQTQQMGTGDVPSSGGYYPANATWVFDGHYSDPRPSTRDGFVAWPPKGYVPYHLVWGRWSLSYPNANFSAATVTMEKGGVNLPVSILPIATGYGENTLVWLPNGMSDGASLPRPDADTTYTITINNVTGAGVPSSFSYSVTVFDPQQPGADTILPVLTGSTNVVAGTTNHYTFNSVPTATGYQWAVSQRTPFTLTEGAENGLTNMTASVPNGYNPIASDIKAAGSYSFHLTNPGFTDQSLTLTRVIVPGAASQLRFQSRLTYATTTQVAKAQISTDGNSWTDLYTQAGSGGSGESVFTLRTASLAAYSGRVISLRFVYDYTGGSAYTQSGSGFGWYLDEITVTGAEELSSTTATAVSTTAFDLGAQTPGDFALRVRTQVYGNYYLEWGPVLRLSVSGPSWLGDTLCARTDGKQQLLWRHVTDSQVSLWTLGTDASLQAATACGPYSGWTVADMLVSRQANTPHLVWTNTTGAISVWNFNSSGAFQTAQTHGPFTGWSYSTSAISPTNNDQWVLWKHTTGQASLWRLNSNSVYQSSTTMGPFTGWSAEELAISPADGKLRLLWKNTDGSVSLWRLSNTGGFEAANTFGPYAGWTAGTLTLGPVDNKVRILWENTSGAISVWRLTTADAYEASTTYGPFSGWLTLGMAMRPDNKLQLPWDRTADHAFSLWRLDSAEGYEGSNSYGPYPGWQVFGGDVDGANKSHLLWRNVDGSISLWRLSPTGTLENTATFGPY